ncbi:hypothetical protein [Pseudomonas sp. NPDC087817]|uniref:hypothetical protein n=1 Tax=Pseudomonas sp. NPDC087817 TaxID=3364451 RepID=UPI00381D988F
MSSGIDWKGDVLPLVKQFLVWYIGKPSRNFITIGVVFWVPGILDLMAMAFQGILALIGHAAAPVVQDDFGPSKMLGTVFIALGVAMTIFEWSQPHSTKANRLRIAKARGRVQQQQTLRTTFKNINDVDLQIAFQDAWGPVNADSQQIRNVLNYKKSNPGLAMDRFIRGMALVKADGSWFALRSRLTPVAFWIYFILMMVAVCAAGICLIVFGASLFHPELKLIPVEAKGTLAVLGLLIGYSVFLFKELVLELGGAVNLVRM